MKTGKNKVDIAIGIILFLCFIFANIYAVRKIIYYGTEVYLYDKLLVAYQIGGMPALKDELGRVIAQDKMRHELVVAKNLRSNLDNIKNPGKFLEQVSARQKLKINLLRNMRGVIFILIAVIFLMRLKIRKNGPRIS